MEWEKGRESDNVLQDEGSSGGFGSRRVFPVRGMRFGIKGIIIVVIISWIAGLNPVDVLLTLSGSGPSGLIQSSTAPVQSNDQQVRFVKTVLGSTEDVWARYFSDSQSRYEMPRLVLFNGHTRSGCGAASEAMGPFYCPIDQRVYLDLDFFQEMESEFNATGDFARAYVIAHEVGHHVQNLLGVMEKVEKEQSRGSRMEGASGLSVRLELQADCLAGVWANRSQEQLHWLQNGDVEAAINAAKQVGDDTLETRSQGYVVPDSFTHGTAAQRVRWFNMGFTSGDVAHCDTFSARNL